MWAVLVGIALGTCGSSYVPPNEVNCADGRDDDCDGLTDAEDPDCPPVDTGRRHTGDYLVRPTGHTGATFIDTGHTGRVRPIDSGGYPIPEPPEDTGLPVDSQLLETGFDTGHWTTPRETGEATGDTGSPTPPTEQAPPSSTSPPLGHRVCSTSPAMTLGALAWVPLLLRRGRSR